MRCMGLLERKKSACSLNLRARNMFTRSLRYFSALLHFVSRAPGKITTRSCMFGRAPAITYKQTSFACSIG